MKFEVHTGCSRTPSAVHGSQTLNVQLSFSPENEREQLEVEAIVNACNSNPLKMDESLLSWKNLIIYRGLVEDYKTFLRKIFIYANTKIE